MNNVPQDKHITVNGADIRYWKEGSGEPVLLVHGLGGFAENWTANVSELAERYLVYLPGFGRSGKTPAPSIRDLVKFIGDFMDALKVEKASLIGNSLGGGLVLQFAVDNPERVDRLVLVDNAGMGREVITDFRVCSIPVLGEMLIRPTREAAIATWKKVVHDPSVIPDDLVSLVQELMLLPGAKKALLTALRSGINIRGQRLELVRELMEKLESLTVPALIIWGRQDRILPVDHAHICRKHLPNSRLELFDKCGHMPQLEHPERFNRLVLEFLDDHPAV